MFRSSAPYAFAHTAPVLGAALSRAATYSLKAICFKGLPLSQLFRASSLGSNPARDRTVRLVLPVASQPWKESPSSAFNSLIRKVELRRDRYFRKIKSTEEGKEAPPLK